MFSFPVLKAAIILNAQHSPERSIAIAWIDTFLNLDLSLNFPVRMSKMSCTRILFYPLFRLQKMEKYSSNHKSLRWTIDWKLQARPVCGLCWLNSNFIAILNPILDLTLLLKHKNRFLKPKVQTFFHHCWNGKKYLHRTVKNIGGKCIFHCNLKYDQPAAFSLKLSQFNFYHSPYQSVINFSQNGWKAIYKTKH